MTESHIRPAFKPLFDYIVDTKNHDLNLSNVIPGHNHWERYHGDECDFQQALTNAFRERGCEMDVIHIHITQLDNLNVPCRNLIIHVTSLDHFDTVAHSRFPTGVVNVRFVLEVPRSLALRFPPSVQKVEFEGFPEGYTVEMIPSERQ